MSGSEFHHLHHVLRLQTGESVVLRDENGTEYQGQITHFSSDTAEIAVTAATPLAHASFCLTLALGLLKGHKMDLVIEKATELGVHTIMPFISASTVAHLPLERQAERLARWQRIAQSAAKQSGSPLPHINPPCSFAQVLTAVPRTADKLLLYEHEHTDTLRAFAESHPGLSAVWIIVGSEGGFSPEEVQHAQQAGCTTVSLGQAILRAETASIAAVALCQFVWR